MSAIYSSPLLLLSVALFDDTVHITPAVRLRGCPSPG